MTLEHFIAFYPQFTGVSGLVMETFIDQANARFSECLDAAEEARRLYIAHKLTLWAQSAVVGGGDNPTMQQLASAGVSAQSLSKSVGGVSISRSEGSGVTSISGYGELKQTVFGVQLIGLLKTMAAGGRYVP